MNQHEFVNKWRTLVALPDFTEIAFYQQHLIDLCMLAGHPPPASTDTANQPFRFERKAGKDAGGTGRADAWYRSHFAIEYKGPGDDLERAYRQLLQYREALDNPPLLIVSDFKRLVIHTNFTDTAKQVITLSLDDLLTNEGLRQVRNLFFNVEAFRPGVTAAQVTEEAAARFGRLAAHLSAWGNDPYAVAHYLIRLLFCLFAEDIDLLPRGLFTRLVEEGKRNPRAFNAKIGGLFGAMANGAYFGEHDIAWFNGGLFNNAGALEMDADALLILAGITQLDWSAIEPAILGTLFTRSLDPQQRAKLGAQYTGKDDILLIVEPVLMAPLRREWTALQSRLRELAARRAAAPNKSAHANLTRQMNGLLTDFAQKVRSVRVLDAACGSGNFLYIALRLLLDLEKAVSTFSGEVGLQPFFPQVSPEQLYGIEVNDYAHELAQATVWIGYLQWLHENGYGYPSEPVLKALDNIKHMDAILAYAADGKPVEPEWPAADVIVGNPPFLGDKKMLSELGENYVASLRNLYRDRLPGQSDLVCYWFEQARTMIEQQRIRRVGLLATQAIRGGANRTVLDRIVSTGAIFWAQSDRNWILDGAAVHVSMVAFDDGSELSRSLNAEAVSSINADLTSSVDLTKAQILDENKRLSFIGPSPHGPFDVDLHIAQTLLSGAINKNGRPNSDVVRPVYSSIDIGQSWRKKWTIDFANMSYQEASSYERPRPDMRSALEGLPRFIATQRVSKHRIFIWLPPEALANDGTTVIARTDDYFFGVLHSKSHELWARRKGTQLREAESGFRYTPTTTFETYPFPCPPGQEPQDDARVQAIAAAARELVAARDAWLNPPDLFGAELNRRTLTNLYNARPAWLDAAHKQLDAAVFAAYGWPDDLGDEEILARLLALNGERAERQAGK